MNVAWQELPGSPKRESVVPAGRLRASKPEPANAYTPGRLYQNGREVLNATTSPLL
jgi:hypothetical protein